MAGLTAYGGMINGLGVGWLGMALSLLDITPDQCSGYIFDCENNQELWYTRCSFAYNVIIFPPVIVLYTAYLVVVTV